MEEIKKIITDEKKEVVKEAGKPIKGTNLIASCVVQ